MAIEANIADRVERLLVVVSIVVQAVQAALVARITHQERALAAHLTSEVTTTHSVAHHPRRQAQAEATILVVTQVAETTLAAATVAVRLDDSVV